MPENRQDKDELTAEWWLVRHGLTSWNMERRYQGHSDQHLLPGEASGLEPLRQAIAKVSFRATYCSDLVRCQETLAYIRPDLRHTAILDHRLREMNFGAWEGQTYDMLKENDLYRSWIDDPQKSTPPGGESWSKFQKRVMSIHDDLRLLSRKLVEEQQQNPIILIITHGGVISMLSSILQPGTGFWDTKAPLGGIIRHQIRL